MAETSVLELVRQWRSAQFVQPPYFFPGDEEVLERAHAVHRFNTLRQYIESEAYGDPDDWRFHVGLLPMPYMGDVFKADIFILTLNPGLAPIDYHAELAHLEFRSGLLQTIRQEHLDASYPFLELDPRRAWQWGYWEQRFRDLALAWRRRHGGTYQDALSSLARRVCVLQLVPYHSRRFDLATKAFQALKSTKLARDFAGQLEERAQRNEVVLILQRGNWGWGLRELEGRIVVYNGPEARGASLSLKSRGGQAIGRWLGI